MINIFYTNNFHDFLFSIQVSEYLYSFVSHISKMDILFDHNMLRTGFNQVNKVRFNLNFLSCWKFYKSQIIRFNTKNKYFIYFSSISFLYREIEWFYRSSISSLRQYRDGNLNLRLEPIRSDLLKLLWSWIEFYEWLRTACLL